jgi:hypothetical protein
MKIKLKITGRSVDTDAPTVDDLIDQLRDYFDILKGVEEALAADGKTEIEWRIIGASKNSPLAFEAAPFARQYAMNIDRRAARVVRATAVGMQSLQTRGKRPEYFSQRVLAKAERLFERVTNGLGETTVDYGPDLPALELTPAAAYVAAANVRTILNPPPATFQELGAVEGIAHGPDLDGWGNRIIKIRLRLTGDDLTCRLSGDALRQVEMRRVGDLWKDCRVIVHGLIYYRGLGLPNRIDGNKIRFFRNNSDLPSVEDIQDEDFTGGVKSEDYLENLHDGTPN